MKKNLKKLTLALASIAVIALSGCAAAVSGAMNVTVTQETVMAETAKYFRADQKDISLLSYDKQALQTQYQIKYNGQLYNCNLYQGNVNCQKPGA